MTRFPTIRRVRIGTFNVGSNLSSETIVKFKRKGLLPFDWKPDIALEETPQEIVKIMSQRPQGDQAIVGGK